MVKCIQKQDLYVCSLQRPNSDIKLTESSGQKKAIPCKWKLKKLGSDTYNRKIDFKTKTFTGNREGHNIMIRDHSKDITIINIFTQHRRT